ncbi:N-acetyltransferase [Hymenobacter gummosus]|uniref:N-acetyltransferase n=1 Tax=Hymenobacter gummosus TaxID=1776032 RepID=A0A431U3I3_9BACT|nr:GNAT family N-acetyltransferase [Hymenobacter gummosus]RTQ50170.1 N-acetyltransferase [Hymenobacter gummosus]
MPAAPPSIRPYQTRDQAACLALFDGNCPPAFDPTERALFERYLAAAPADFWVLEADGAVRACGGYGSRDAGQSWELYWGMVGRDWHGRGLGRQLLEFRIRHLQARYPGVRIISRTSQYAQGFFARRGFVLHRVAEHFWGPGLHLYDMSLAPA